MTNRITLLARAEEYQRRGRSLPLDLYAKLLGLGIDASQYNQPLGIKQERISEVPYDLAADLLAQEQEAYDRELAQIDDELLRIDPEGGHP